MKHTGPLVALALLLAGCGGSHKATRTEPTQGSAFKAAAVYNAERSGGLGVDCYDTVEKVVDSSGAGHAIELCVRRTDQATTLYCFTAYPGGAFQLYGTAVQYTSLAPGQLRNWTAPCKRATAETFQVIARGG
jgi:hypothetical protein